MDLYVSPDHQRTGGYESCCDCGGWPPGDPYEGRRCDEEWLMSDDRDVPDLSSIRGERIASDAEYIEQLEGLSVGQERERQKWQARAERAEAERDHLGDELHRERMVKRINDQALLKAVKERDRLRAIVDGLRTGLEMVESVTDIDVAHGYARAALDASGPNDETDAEYVARIEDDREEVHHAYAQVDDLDRFIREQGPEFAALVKIGLVEAERDRLRAVVDAVRVAVDECRRHADMPGRFATFFDTIAALDVSAESIDG